MELKEILKEIARGEKDLEALAPSLTLKEREYLIKTLEGQLKKFEKKLHKVISKKEKILKKGRRGD